MNRLVRREPGLAVLVASLLAPSALYAYGGPGSVVSGVGALLAVLAALLAATFGFLWFPVKRLIKMFREGKEQEGTDAAESTEELAGE